MTTQTDARRVALSAPADSRSVLRPEAAGSEVPAPSLTASSGGGVSCLVAARRQLTPRVPLPVSTRTESAGLS